MKTIVLYVFILTLFSSLNIFSCFEDSETKLLFKVEVLKEGDNATYAKSGNLITLHFTGTFVESKKKFDSSYDKNEPAKIVIGKGIMIECWERIIPKISLGEKVSFVCPYSLAYGTQGVPKKVPPKTNLAYEVEIINIVEGNHEEL
jgi:FK506-binding protein 1